MCCVCKIEILPERYNGIANRIDNGIYKTMKGLKLFSFEETRKVKSLFTLEGGKTFHVAPISKALTIHG